MLPTVVTPPPPGSGEPQLLDEPTLTDLLGVLWQRPLFAGEQGVRLSLAGAQDKLAVCLNDGQFVLAKDGRPNTHIPKPFIEGVHDTLENEWFCLTLASRVGLAVPVVASGLFYSQIRATAALIGYTSVTHRLQVFGSDLTDHINRNLVGQVQ